MSLNNIVEEIHESLTLKINEQISSLRDSGKKVVNLTSGQLHFRPPLSFISLIEKNLNFLKSFQYSPNAGMQDLRDKFFRSYQERRKVKISPASFDCLISNGSKQALYLALKTLIREGDEVILFAPYWGSYNELLKLCNAKVTVVESLSYNKFHPDLEEVRSAITDKTKLLILNSPNNPTGVHYSDEWMSDFNSLVSEFENLYVLSDEAYSEICYFDPKPSYFYENSEDLSDKVIIVNSISKSLASTGLRVGYCIANKEIISNMVKLQSQVSSGPSSLIQNALLEYDFEELGDFFNPIYTSIRKCAQILRDAYVANEKSHFWYQTSSAFYYLIDFSHFEFFSKFDEHTDNSEEICESILSDIGVAMVPGSFFGAKNCARISMTIEEDSFKEAIDVLMKYLRE